MPSPPKNKPPFYPVKKIKKEKKILTSNPNVKIIKIEADAEVTVSTRTNRIENQKDCEGGFSRDEFNSEMLDRNFQRYF